jgi:hypothetical protein
MTNVPLRCYLRVRYDIEGPVNATGVEATGADSRRVGRDFANHSHNVVALRRIYEVRGAKLPCDRLFRSQGVDGNDLRSALNT